MLSTPSRVSEASEQYNFDFINDTPANDDQAGSTFTWDPVFSSSHKNYS
jgi:hypothetical protein